MWGFVDKKPLFRVHWTIDLKSRRLNDRQGNINNTDRAVIVGYPQCRFVIRSVGTLLTERYWPVESHFAEFYSTFNANRRSSCCHKEKEVEKVEAKEKEEDEEMKVEKEEKEDNDNGLTKFLTRKADVRG
ncbi:hypothetical protein V1478_016697 [Vespula squamosa]|uniref:Uncharacterized protein n=1 Tax=Vespula squamosa TaxID=30214 RepID=A0ABD2A370_VESSQ